MLYVNVNGEILENDQGVIKAGNRGHLYGDGIFESIRILNGKPINLSNHVNRMMEASAQLHMRVPNYYNADFFEGQTKDLLYRSSITGGGRCRIHLDRISGGTYTPESNEVEYMIEVYPIDDNRFNLNTRGVEIDIYMKLKKTKSVLSNYKTKNGLIYVLSAIEARKNGFDDYLITNENGGILESTCCNLFVVSNGVLYTPGLEEGCLAGTMRMQIINLALANGIKVYECNILPQNLLVADEIFLTNAISGIRWVQGYRTKRYQNHMATRLVGLLNAKWLG